MADDKKRSAEAAVGGAPQKKPKGTWQKNLPPGAVDKAIPAGAVGILLTCDAGKDRRASEELINILEESYARMDKDHVGRKAPAASPADSSKQSVEAKLAAEVAELKDKRKARFKRHETNVRGTAFVELPKGDGCPTPEEVAAEIGKHVRSTQSLPSRHVMRIIPISQTCFVSEDDVRVLAAKLAELHFPKDSQSIQFAVDFERRACDKLERKDVIDIMANAVPQPPHKVNLNTPQKTIVVQLVRNVCAVGVAEGYRDLLKMNLRKLADGEEAPAAKQPKAAAATEVAAVAAVPTEAAVDDQTADAAEK